MGGYKTICMKNLTGARHIIIFPGLFEFYEFYRIFLPLFYEHREYFYDCVRLVLFMVPSDCVWGGGRISSGEYNPQDVLTLMEEYRISARLTFSNSLLLKEHLMDKKCNELCALFEKSTKIKNGIIIHSDLLLNYLKNNYPGFYFVSSTTKVLTDFKQLEYELNREDFLYVVPDFRLNKLFDKLKGLSQPQKDKLSFYATSAVGLAAKTENIVMRLSVVKILEKNVLIITALRLMLLRVIVFQKQ